MKHDLNLWNINDKVRIVKKIDIKIGNIRKGARHSGHFNLLKSPYQIDLKNPTYTVIPVRSFERRWHRFEDWLNKLIEEKKLPDGTYYIYGRAMIRGSLAYLYQRPVYTFKVSDGKGVFQKKLPRTFNKLYYKPSKKHHTKKKTSRNYAIFEFLDPY